MRFKIIILVLLLFFVSLPAIAATNEAIQKSYDGLWFMGFNFHKDIFEGDSGKSVRKAVNMAINRKHIAISIIGDAVVPNGVIPPGMDGYDPSLKGYPYDAKKAKALLRQSGYLKNNQPIKMSLLHTDGVKTREIANLIKKNLGTIGIKLSLKEVSYKDAGQWDDELESGVFHLFLIGYKTTSPDTLFIGGKMDKVFHVLGCERTPDPDQQVFFSRYDEAIISGYRPCTICKPKREKAPNSDDLITAMFSPRGEVNFGYYRNPRVDFLLEQLSVLSPALNKEREDKLKELNQILLDDAASVNLFYITRL